MADYLSDEQTLKELHLHLTPDSSDDSLNTKSKDRNVDKHRGNNSKHDKENLPARGSSRRQILKEQNGNVHMPASKTRSTYLPPMPLIRNPIASTSLLRNGRSNNLPAVVQPPSTRNQNDSVEPQSLSNDDDAPFTSSPKNSSVNITGNDDIITLLKTILSNQNVLKHTLQDMQLSVQLLEQDIIDVKKNVNDIQLSAKGSEQSSLSIVEVPNEIRLAVKRGYAAEVAKNGIPWQKGFKISCRSPVNMKVTQQVEGYVKAMHPDVAPLALDKAIRRYFKTKCELRSGPGTAIHNLNMKHYQRKKNKRQRRQIALPKMGYSPEDTENMKLALKQDVMSSEESDDDGTLHVKQYKWPSRRWRRRKKRLDRKYLESQTKRSRYQTFKRVKGEVCDDEPPLLPASLAWMIATPDEADEPAEGDNGNA